MADNATRWVGNLGGAAEPLIKLGKFVAGATTAIKRGELIELTGSTNTTWIPIDSDFDMDANIAIMNEEIKSGDLAGYYEIIVPRPDDIFEYELAAASNPSVGAALYFSASDKVTVSAGTNILARVVGQEHYPQKQGHASDDASGDRGTTIRSDTHVRCVIAQDNSYYAAMVANA